jgi:hypothetical protein
VEEKTMENVSPETLERDKVRVFTEKHAPKKIKNNAFLKQGK